ncbi:MAG: DUF11 domain-containing protein, partial [Anaerolineae bacterium]
FVSNPNLNTDYPPAPQITAIGGITGGQVISGSLVVSAAIRYAGLSRVVFRLTGPGGAEAYSSTVAYTATDYADPYCMGSSPGSCAPWNSALVANGLYTLTVTATDKLSAGLGGPQTGSLARTMIRVSNTVTAANLSVVKRAARDPAPLDAPLTYTLYLTNTGPDPATGVVLTDTLPPGLLFASAVPTCTLAGSDVVCAAGALGVNAAFSVTVLVTPTAAGTATNVARAAANELDPDPGNNIYTETAFITTPNLALGKRASPDAVPLGQPITYTLNVTNRGPGAVLSVTLTDTLPTGVNLASVTPPAPACVPSGGDVICTLGSLVGGASATVTLRVTPTVRGVITTTARVGGFPADQHPADNTASAATLVGVADLSVSKVDSADPAPAGSVATYTITVRNLGPDTASGVVVTDTLPPGTPPLAFSDPPCVLAGNELGCTLGTLAPQATRTLTVTVQPAATGTITNSVRVAGVEPDPNPANNSAAQPTTFSTPDLSVEKRAAVILVPPGRPLTYTLTVANLGPGPASGVVLTDTLPPGVLFSQAVPGAPTCVEAGGRVTCSLGSMPAGDARQITIVVTPTAAAAITNTAAVASDRPDSDPANNTAAATVLVEAPASLPYVYSVSKDDALLRVINPADGATVSTVRVKVAGGTVQQINGLATNPATGDMWALLKLHGQSTRELAIINPVTGRATRIGDTGPGRFSTIAFNPAGTVLFGVTGDGSPLDSQTLFTLSLTNAAPSKVMPLGNGNEGEAIAFNADNGLLYHASGYGPQNDSLKGEIFEAVNVT